MKSRSAAAALVLCLLGPAGAFAGPPYATDDPEPVELRHWEVYLASQSAFGSGGFAGTSPHFEVNYGALPGLQLHVLAPLVLAFGGGAPARYGIGDLELGAKYRFLDEEKAGVQLGTFPIATLPSGSEARGLGAGSATLFLPLWLQKSFGPWTTYGGGGYRIRTAADASNSWFLGWLLQRKVGPAALGLELYRETDSAQTLSGTGGFSLGGVFDFSDEHHLLLSFGASQGAPALHAYVGYQLTLGPRE